MQHQGVTFLFAFFQNPIQKHFLKTLVPPAKSAKAMRAAARMVKIFHTALKKILYFSLYICLLMGYY